MAFNPFMAAARFPRAIGQATKAAFRGFVEVIYEAGKEPVERKRKFCSLDSARSDMRRTPGHEIIIPAHPSGRIDFGGAGRFLRRGPNERSDDGWEHGFD